MSLPISKGSALQKNQERLLIAVENSQSFPAAAERSPAPGNECPVDVRGHSAVGDPLKGDCLRHWIASGLALAIPVEKFDNLGFFVYPNSVVHWPSLSVLRHHEGCSRNDTSNTGMCVCHYCLVP